MAGISRGDRIIIVGGGAAGIAAARALVKAGHREVVVLEREARVGGKCRTFEHDGRAYELGAGALTSAYRNVRTLADELGVTARPGVGGVFIRDRRRPTYLPPGVHWSNLWRFGLEGLRLLAEVARLRGLREPGFRGLPPALAVPFSTWAAARGVTRGAALVEPWITGFGYGRLDDVPAAYVLKYLQLFRAPVYELLDTGYQGLMERAALGLDVRTGAPVTRVTRPDGGPITVDTAAGSLACDALILACPLDAALGFLDASGEERDLLSRVVYNDYHVIAAELDAPPRDRYGFFAGHFGREHDGRPVFFYRRFLDRDLVLVYTCPPAGATLDDSEAAVRRDVALLGARIRRVHLRHAWRYFPHVSSPDLAAGFYDRLEALQGARRTFYAGELLSFTAVECVVAYSNALVARVYPGANWTVASGS